MTELEILKLQVEALEKLVKIKNDTIDALQKSNLNPATTTIYIPYTPTITSVWQCQHQYPSLWGGTGSPSCIKCGQPMSGAGGGAGGNINLGGTLQGQVGQAGTGTTGLAQPFVSCGYGG